MRLCHRNLCTDCLWRRYFPKRDSALKPLRMSNYNRILDYQLLPDNCKVEKWSRQWMLNVGQGRCHTRGKSDSRYLPGTHPFVATRYGKGESGICLVYSCTPTTALRLHASDLRRIVCLSGVSNGISSTKYHDLSAKSRNMGVQWGYPI